MSKVRFGPRQWSRRSLIRAAGISVPAFATATLVGCGDDDDDDDDSNGGSTPNSSASPTVAVSAIEGAKPGDRIALAEDTYFTSTGQKAAGTFRHNTEYAGFTAEPNQSYQGDYIMNRLAYNSLYGIQWPSYSTMMYLVKSIEEVDDTTWIIHLRENVKWHNKAPINGRTLSGNDVKYTIERMKADKTSSFNIWHAYLNTVEVTSPTTVKMTSNGPYSSKFDPVPFSIVPEGIIESFGDISKKGIGTGPYMFDGDYDPTGVTNFTKNPDFWLQNRPFPEKIEFRHFVDQAAQIAAFRSNQIDFLGRALQKPVAESLVSADGVLTEVPFLGLRYLGINGNKPPLNDVRVRQAISLAIDRKELIQKLEFGQAVACGPVPPGQGAFALPQKEVDDFYKIDSYAANLAEAKKLVEAVGSSSLPEFTVLAPADLPTFASGAPLIATMLRNAGFKVTEDLKPLTTVVREHLITGDFTLIFMQTGTVEDPLQHLQQHVSMGNPGVSGSGRFGQSDPAIDSAATAMVQTTEFEGRVAKAHEASRAIMKSYGGQLNLWQATASFVTKKHLKDFRTSTALSTYDQYDYWLDA